MTDAGIIKDMEACAKQSCSECSMYDRIEIEVYCDLELMKEALDLIKRQQAEIDKLTDRAAIRAIDRIHYNIAEMNLIHEGYNMEELKRRFRAEFEEKMELGLDDCINWADWLDSIASEMWEEVKGETDDR